MQRLRRALILLSVLASSVGLVRFVTTEALPGMVQGSLQAMGGRAVSRLREILRAQQAAEKLALIDPDRDGVGSAALLSELAGVEPPPSERARPMPILDRVYRATVNSPQGAVVKAGGYLFRVCLPDLSGGWTTSRARAAIDGDETRFRAFAWPQNRALGARLAYSIDETDSILQQAQDETSATAYFGAANPPSCQSITPPHSWQRWRNKQPKSSALPSLSERKRAGVPLPSSN